MNTYNKTTQQIIEDLINSNDMSNEVVVRHLVETNPELATQLLCEQLRLLSDSKSSVSSGLSTFDDNLDAAFLKSKPGNKS